MTMTEILSAPSPGHSVVSLVGERSLSGYTEVQVSYADNLLENCFCRLALDRCKLWLDPSKTSVAVIDSFNDVCSQYYSDLKKEEAQKVAGRAGEEGGLIDEANGPAAIFRLSPLGVFKAIKNAEELEGMKQAHLR
jgi:Xaa-Pro aminopeptidase